MEIHSFLYEWIPRHSGPWRDANSAGKEDALDCLSEHILLIAIGAYEYIIIIIHNLLLIIILLLDTDSSGTIEFRVIVVSGALSFPRV
jgi:hypothetical protein